MESWLVAYDYSENLQMQIIDIDADELEKISLPVELIANNIIPQLDEITRENLTSVNGIDGIIMLFLLLLISRKMQGTL